MGTQLAARGCIATKRLKKKKEWKLFLTPKQVRQLFNYANFSKKFIDHFVSKAGALSSILGNNLKKLLGED
jgi:hypothetical protein